MTADVVDSVPIDISIKRKRFLPEMTPGRIKPSQKQRSESKQKSITVLEYSDENNNQESLEESSLPLSSVEIEHSVNVV